MPHATVTWAVVKLWVVLGLLTSSIVLVRLRHTYELETLSVTFQGGFYTLARHMGAPNLTKGILAARAPSEVKCSHRKGQLTIGPSRADTVRGIPPLILHQNVFK